MTQARVMSLCKVCERPMRPKSAREKYPGEYDHAKGCPYSNASGQRIGKNWRRGRRMTSVMRGVFNRKVVRLSLLAHIHRFWLNVDRLRGPTPSRRRLGRCWIWTVPSASQKHRPNFYRGAGSRKISATRLAFLLQQRGRLIGQVCHHCDNGVCVRGSHLFQGTQKDNMRDCAKKGRLGGAVLARGSSVFTAKLSEQDVRTIRRLGAEPGRSGVRVKRGVHLSLAKKYGVTSHQVWMIVHGRAWKHVQ